MALMNPKNPKQKNTSYKINNHGGGGDKFHGARILEFWFKIYVEHANVPSHPLLHPHDADDQAFV